MPVWSGMALKHIIKKTLTTGDNKNNDYVSAPRTGALSQATCIAHASH